MKDRVTFSILAILLGGIGVHYFYMGKAGKGILCVLFCWSFVPALIGLITGIIWLTRNDMDFRIAFDVPNPAPAPPTVAELAAIEAQRAAEAAQREADEARRKELSAQREAEARAAAEIRRAALIEKYGEEMTAVILSGQVSIGMPYDAVIEALDNPGDMKEDRNKDIHKQKLFYGAYTNAQKNTSYKHEIRLENGVVTGWKDL